MAADWVLVVSEALTCYESKGYLYKSLGYSDCGPRDKAGGDALTNDPCTQRKGG